MRVECTRCPRKGRYRVAKLVAQHGRLGNMSKWMSDLKGDCPKRSNAIVQHGKISQSPRAGFHG